MKQLQDIRKDYATQSLDTTEVRPDPLDQFKKWMEEALRSDLPEPTAMHLASVGEDGQPAGRMVLLKGVEDGFVFFTNYESHKGQELLQRPKAALTFFWAELERQVRVEGSVRKYDAAKSDAYFNSRPYESRVGAHSSPQSEEIPSRAYLEELYKANLERFNPETIQRPSFWGGLELIPEYIEFWQGRPSRLHDRIAYRKQEDGSWKIVRLAP
jgi:pyridoxamine 5'-phosphate oxidase